MSAAGRTILLVEGNPDHAKLIEQHLVRAGEEALEVVVRDCLSAALVRLGVGGVDAILANLRLPDCNGFEVLTTLGSKAPKTPIIALSSKDDPDIMTGAIRSGAQDCLCKTKLSGELMLRSVQLAAERMKAASRTDHADDALSESEARIRAIINASLDCIISMDSEGKIVQFNPAAEKTFGYQSQEVIGKEMGELFMPPDVRERQTPQLSDFSKLRRRFDDGPTSGCACLPQGRNGVYRRDGDTRSHAGWRVGVHRLPARHY